MIGIVIVAHGNLAAEYLAAMEHVVGKQDGAIAVPVSANCDRAMVQEKISAAIKSVDDGDGVVVTTDMFGGTPSNLAVAACGRADRRVIYGANLPLLIKLAKLRDKPLNVAVEKAITAARKYLNCADGHMGSSREAAE